MQDIREVPEYAWEATARYREFLQRIWTSDCQCATQISILMAGVFENCLVLFVYKR